MTKLKLQLLKFFAELAPAKQLTMFLIMAVMTLFSWVFRLIGNDSTDRKQELLAAKKECATATAMLREEKNLWQWKYDSILNRAVHDKEETIQLLRQVWDNSQTIKKQIIKK